MISRTDVWNRWLTTHALTLLDPTSGTKATVDAIESNEQTRHNNFVARPFLFRLFRVLLQAFKACAICSAAAWASGTSPRICKKPCTMPLAQM